VKKFLAIDSNKNFFFAGFDDKNKILGFLWLKMWLKKLFFLSSGNFFLKIYEKLS